MLNATVSNLLGSSASNIYDSLTITKASFIIQEDENDQKGKIAPVMINPSTISVDTSNRLQKAQGTGLTGGISKVEKENNGAAKSIVTDTINRIETRVSMELIYDLVFQYDLIKSRNGAGSGLISGMVSDDNGFGKSLVGGLSESVTKCSEVNLFNKKEYSFLDMQDACSKQKAVAFVWGPMIYSGVIESFNSTFTYFSSAGAPLRAKVRLTMLCTQDARRDFQDNNLLSNLTNLFKKKADEDGEISGNEMRG